jgi:hypothetical protein
MGFGSPYEDIIHLYRFKITNSTESIPGSMGRSCYFYRFWITKHVICPPLVPLWGDKLNCKTLKVGSGSLECLLEIPDVRFPFSARRQDIRYEACMMLSSVPLGRSRDVTLFNLSMLASMHRTDLHILHVLPASVHHTVVNMFSVP